LRIIFAGTPDFAATILTELVKKHAVIGVYTQPDRAAGRGQKLNFSPVKQLALQHSIPVFQPKSLRSNKAQRELAALKPDILIVVAYGLLLPNSVLELPTHGCLNVHASLLPRWRGAAPIQRALLHGDSETGVTIMQMNEGLDTGDMLLKKSCSILKTDTSETLHDKLAQIGSTTLLEALANLDHLKPEKQNNNVSCYAEKIQKQDGQIDWQESAEHIDRMIRAFHPWPGTFTHLDNHVLKIWQAEITPIKNEKTPGTIVKADKEGLDITTGSTVLRITQCQLPGGKAMAVSAILNAKKNLFSVGKQL